MALPSQIQRQADAVDKLYEDLVQEDATDGGQADTADEPKVVDTAHRDEDNASEPKAEEQAEGNQADEEETYEQRWRSLQGKYNAELPRLQADNRGLTTRVQQLEQLISSLSTQPAKEQPAPAQLITEQDVEDYGDSIDVMRRVFREEMSSKDAELAELRQMLQQVQTNVVPQVQQLAHNQTVSSEQRFWADLQLAVPDWQEVNAGEGFQSWLLETDPLTGVQRQTYLDDAQRVMDASRVVNFFNTWKGQNGAPEARTTRQTQAATELERQVSPGKGRSGGAKSQGEPQNYSTDDIRAFFADVQKGKYKGKEAERDRIERDIFAAQREGRIVNA